MNDAYQIVNGVEQAGPHPEAGAEGADAFAQGKARDTNPYAIATHPWSRSDWDAAWVKSAEAANGQEV